MKSPALQLAFHEAAEDDMGIYPMATRHPDGREEKRTEWQDGWNAAVIGHTDKICKIGKWFDELPEHLQPIVEELIVGEALSLSIGDDGIQTYLRVNDTFYYACSDCEDVTLEDLPLIRVMWREYGYDGLVAWVAKKRNIEPVQEYRNSHYRRALECYGEQPNPQIAIPKVQPEIHSHGPLPRWLRAFGSRLFRRKAKIELKSGVMPDTQGWLKKVRGRIGWMWY
jgi:hypothetical protein